jgi:hypothetical protein
MRTLKWAVLGVLWRLLDAEHTGRTLQGAPALLSQTRPGVPASSLQGVLHRDSAHVWTWSCQERTRLALGAAPRLTAMQLREMRGRELYSGAV